MLSGKPRPVPSKAALKVLYQLAYISSGTAVGVAALCAEERRRRTQLVQKVADNARRIRQSPRYFQNAALAAPEVDDYDVGRAGSEWVSHREHGRGRKGERPQSGNNELAIRGPELPSVVEDAYTEARRQERSGRQRSTARRRPLRAIQAVHHVTPDGADAMGTIGAAGNILRSSPQSIAPSVESEPGQVQTSSAWQDNLAYRTLKRTSPKPRSPLVPVSSGSQLNARWDHRPPALDLEVSRDLRDDIIRTRHAWRRLSGHLPEAERPTAASIEVSADDILHDVGLFFDCVQECGAEPSAKRAVRVANHLMSQALRYGTLDDVRSLFLWKLSRNLFTELDAHFLCDAAKSLSSRSDHEELLGFYTDVFRKSPFLRLDSQRSLQLRLSVLTEAMEWSTQYTPAATARAFFRVRSKSSTCEALTQLLSEKCHVLLAGGLVQRATDLIVSLRSLCSGCQGFNIIIDTSFKAALEAGSLSSSAKLLRLASFPKLLNLQVLKNYCEAFLVACDAHGSYGTVLELFATSRRMKGLDNVALSIKSHEIIAIACTTAHDMTTEIAAAFREANRRVPKALRGRIVQSRSCLRLKAIWDSTHNLTQVRQMMRTIPDWLRKYGTERDQRAWTFAQLEIYISANQLDLALSTIARIHGSQPMDGQTVSLAAVVLAKKGAWDLLERLLSIACNSAMLSFDVDMTRRFNNVLRLYSEQHSTEETWKFVFAAIHDMGFHPNHATTEIMLESFVARKDLSLIPKWLRHLQILGHRFELSARVAAKLLVRFYLDHRPSHVLIMWFCRNLVHCAPSLAGPEFIDLVKEAIGYDVRKATGQYRVWRRSSARSRLALLDHAGDDVPSPGYRWNGELYLEKPNSDRATQRPTSFAGDREVEGTITAHAGLAATGGSVTMPLANIDIAPTTRMVDVPSSSINRPAGTNAEEENFRLITAPNDGTQSIAASQYGPVPGLQLSDPELFSTVRFEDLRPTYSAEDTDGDMAKTEHSEDLNVPELQSASSSQSRPERDMILAMSLAQYAKVIELYNVSRDAIVLPASPLALEVAVEASLRLHRGNRAEAEDMMRQARDAGMNVTCAMGPLLIQQMNHLNSTDKKDINNLRVSVIEYYRMNDESGWPVKHHVGITAANLLINTRQPSHGLNILDAIYRSEWAAKRPLDIVAMTVFVKGYAALWSMEGIEWVITTVLAQDMRVDQKFLSALRAATKRFGSTAYGAIPMYSEERGERPPNPVPVLLRWSRQCHERRAKQMFQAEVLGKKLVACLAKCANEQQQQPAIQTSARGELEDAIFGERMKALDSLPVANADSAAGHPGLMYLERLKRRVAQTIRAEQQLERRGQRGRALGAYDRKWIKQYRAFLRRNLVMPDGKLASFRYRLVDEPEQGLPSNKQAKSASYGSG
ncbi:hypothetical protein LTR85_005048 [Meristemomyces frigidus]|nr:hypothetical protein LTR85_005048 [Meristemomyces frigidus]